MQDKRLATTGEPDAVTDELANAQVVAATTASCGSRAVREQAFDVAIIDEAGQLTEPGTLAAINRADRFVLVGDHHQLPPVVRADGESRNETDGPTGDEPRGSDLQTSLFERLIEQAPEAGVLLDRQYRMAQRVQSFSSREFYDGKLRPATAEQAGQTLADIGVATADLPPELREQVTFVDPDGTQLGNRNPTEADRVAEIVESYVAAGVARSDIGVIAPFRAQVAELSRRLPETTVDTVDRFQGSAKEVIVISFVATGGFDGPIFEDTRRTNVALTRAKRALVLVGDAETLASEPFYERLLAWARA